mmetsp:Transcript_16135/g.37778  ORF Transcript_16135/g.37778 Transcript_16135/m.37778 type:complete len:316 (+) Transcript_16135:987-1934(+)
MLHDVQCQNFGSALVRFADVLWVKQYLGGTSAGDGVGALDKASAFGECECAGPQSAASSVAQGSPGSASLSCPLSEATSREQDARAWISCGGGGGGGSGAGKGSLMSGTATATLNPPWRGCGIACTAGCSASTKSPPQPHVGVCGSSATLSSWSAPGTTSESDIGAPTFGWPCAAACPARCSTCGSSGRLPNVGPAMSTAQSQRWLPVSTADELMPPTLGGASGTGGSRDVLRSVWRCHARDAASGSKRDITCPLSEPLAPVSLRPADEGASAGTTGDGHGSSSTSHVHFLLEGSCSSTNTLPGGTPSGTVRSRS